jgi:hypothetical protein
MAARLFGGSKGELHAVEAIGRKAGLSPEKIHEVTEWAKKAILPLFDDFGVEPHAKEHILQTAVHVAIEHAAGRVPRSLVESWDKLVMEELIARRIPRAKAREILLNIDERLLEERPHAERALRRAYPIPRHPVISRHLVNWELRRRGEDAKPSGQVASTALKSLAASPLGSDLDAA